MVAAHGKETPKEQEAQPEKREAENGHDEPDAKKQRKEYSEQSTGKDKKKEKSEEKDEEQQAQHEKQAGEQEGEQGGGSDTESEYDPDEDHDDERDVPKVFDERKPEPKRAEDGTLIFDDYPDFVPNLTPKEVLQKGGFGGTYFREIKSAVIGEVICADGWKEYPQDWFKGLDPEKHLTRPWGEYDKSINNYGVKCGRELEFWEEKGWISPIDPRGWFQWYCRFYCGRRSEDDQRQVGRALRLMGPKGRFRNQLINRIAREGKTYDDRSVSPVMRQVLQHWGYELTEKDFKEYARSKGHDV